jgi:polyphenol oxidase
MRWKAFDHLHWLEFDLLADIPHLQHALCTRQGGCSQNSYAGLNVSKRVGDNEADVETNLQRLKKTQGLSTLIYPHMVHGVTVIEITPENLSAPLECDAMITRLTGVSLVTTQADCQTAIIYDPVQHAVANVHCGWRGNVQNIYRHTILKMASTYDSRPENLLVCIGPSLGPTRAEFVNYRDEFPSEWWKYQVAPFYFDLWEISRQQLLECGIQDSHIEIARMCTYSQPELFYSYRRDKVTGRHPTLVMLR